MRRARTAQTAWTAWWLAALLASSRASAQEAASAPGELEALISQANELRRNGRDEDAVALLRRAATLDQSPRTLAQLALGEQSIGRWPRSEALFVRALTAQNDPWIERHRATLEAALAAARAHLATVDVVGGDPAAELWIDGESLGALRDHRQLRVAAGSVRIEHRPAARPAAIRVIELGAGAHERVYFAPSAPLVLQATPRVTTASPRAAGPRPPRPREPAVHSLVWIGAATTGAAVTANLISWAVAQSVVQRYDAVCVDALAIDVVACQARLRAEQPQLDAIGAATDIGWAVLAAGLATGGVGVVLSVRERSASIRGQF